MLYISLSVSTPVLQLFSLIDSYSLNTIIYTSHKTYIKSHILPIAILPGHLFFTENIFAVPGMHYMNSFKSLSDSLGGHVGLSC